MALILELMIAHVGWLPHGIGLRVRIWGPLAYPKPYKYPLPYFIYYFTLLQYSSYHIGFRLKVRAYDL